MDGASLEDLVVAYRKQDKGLNEVLAYFTEEHKTHKHKFGTRREPKTTIQLAPCQLLRKFQKNQTQSLGLLSVQQLQV